MTTLIEQLNERGFGRTLTVQRDAEAGLPMGAIAPGHFGLMLISYMDIEDRTGARMISTGQHDGEDWRDFPGDEALRQMCDALAHSYGGAVDLSQVVLVDKPPREISTDDYRAARALASSEAVWPGPVVLVRDDPERPGDLQALLSSDVVVSRGPDGDYAVTVWWNPITENGIISGGIEAEQ